MYNKTKLINKTKKRDKFIQVESKAMLAQSMFEIRY